ncbi:hypothetical protein [Bradyrhizobium sp. CCGB01]|uniref:hypothetical protein n=1 Tax=Bradyrhizobium sp. CCGB01 TaxID=2949634 RepID=UPI0020B36958|nr:hypothetical protein [Bradyrhizobium sp. CCGB01]MCP3404463.1 hypothetical protein [Bradyrhizobium sp. CCGB01]
MTVTTRIHCLTDVEPTAFHGAGGDKAYAVNLNIECEAVLPFDDTARSEARAAFDLFLQKAAAAEFHLFKVTFGQLPAPHTGKTGITKLDWLYKIGEGGGRVLSESAIADNKILLAWLEEGAAVRRADALKRSIKTTEADRQAEAAAAERSYWLIASGGNGSDKIDQTEIGATHELRSAHAWNAPVAHRFGLTKLLLLPFTDADLKTDGIFYLVLPSFDGNPPVPDISATAPFDDGSPAETVDIPYDLNAGFVHPTVCRAARLLLPQDDFPGLVGADGFLKVDQQPDQVRRLLNWFEQGAASLISPLPGLTRDQAKNGVSVSHLFAPSWTTSGVEPNLTFELKAFGTAWRLVASLCIALDPMIIGLMRPALKPASAVELDPRPEGQVLSMLVSGILRQLDQVRLTDAAVFPTGKLPDEMIIAGAVREFLQKGDLFDTAPEKFGQALRYIHGIGPPDASSPAEDVLLDVLFTCFLAGPGQRIALDATRVKKIARFDPKTGNPDGFGPDPLALAITRNNELHKEAGFEAAILRFFEAAAVKPATGPQPSISTLVSEQLAKSVADKAGLDAGKIVTPVAKAWQEFRTTLEGAFNGAEAARRSAGADLLTALLGPQGGQPLKAMQDTVSSLATLILDGSKFSDCLFRNGTGCFADIIKSLPRPEAPDAIKADDTFLKILEEAHTDAMAPLSDFVSESAQLPMRFVPDNVPHPLPVQIGDSLAAADVDRFARHFNGIAVAIRRVDNDNSPFVHLNLASLTWTGAKGTDGKFKFAEAADENGAIHPILPALVDGRSALFLNYEGFPFASTAFSTTVPYTDDEETPARRPLNIHEVADYTGDWLKKMPPRLAYGRTFETFAFVTTNSGSLPPALFSSADTPWRSAKDIVAKKIDEAVKSKAPCHRRTAVGRIAITELAGNKGGAGSKRIGGSLPGVYPLATDYPRLILSTCDPATPDAVDLMRLADGSGGFIFPTEIGEAKRSKLGLADPDWLGGKGRLDIGIFTLPARLDTVADVSISNIPGGGSGFNGSGELFLSVERKANAVDTYTVALYVDATPLGHTELVTRIDRGWFRLTLRAEDVGKPVVFSFAEPEGQGGAGHGIRDTPLLLLAPAREGWQSGLAEPIHAKIDAPRTGYLDFERWFANADLRTDVFMGVDKATMFFDALLTAYVMRHRDKDLAESLSNLPDPSVVALRVTLAVADRLGEQPVIMLQKDIELKDLLALVVKAIPSDGTEDGVPVRKKAWSVKDLKSQIFERVRDKFTFDLAVSPGALSLTVSVDRAHDAGSGGRIIVQVPAGVVAQFSIAPMVEARHFSEKVHAGITFPSVCHPGLLQHVAANYGSLLVFPATALRIETMADVLVSQDRATELARRIVTVTPVQSARRYDLTSRGDIEGLRWPLATDRNDWRMIGEIDITTQRWRVTGRPIYNFVNPREFRADGKTEDAVVHSALALRNPKNDALSSFETEAFFDRINLDSETVIQRLLPLPSATVLQTFPWNDPSATYFRHHFRLRSRYAGALVNQNRRSVPAWPAPDRNAPDPLQEWTLRVAMLADHSNLTVTRPQLRALIPLTTSTGAASLSRSTPPLLAVLQEPPFAQAGLADRIAAEISTGFGYGFDAPREDEEPDHVERVHILDSRKEVGPDPRSTYRAMPKERAFGLTMRAEGPLGLTFDQQNAPAPAFANSLLSLMPFSVTEVSQPVLEEHFLGVALRRHIDPNWMNVNPIHSGKNISFDPERAAWIELPDAARRHGNSPYEIILKHGSTSEEFLKIATGTAGTKPREIRIAKVMLDPVPARPGDRDVVIAHFSPSQIARLVLLHQPVAPKRYSTSILGFPTSAKDTDDNSQNILPLVLASFEWSPRRIVDLESQPESEEIIEATIWLDEAAVWPGTMSARTFLSWTRTGIDHDRGRMLTLSQESGQMEVESFDFGDVEAWIDASNVFSLRRGNTGIGVPIWAVSSTFAETSFPVHIHRHLAVISTHFADGAGRPVEAFSRADLVKGKTTSLMALNDRKKISCCRIVEFETPAMILTGTPSDLIPDTYKTAYFDLRSSGYKSGSIRLFFRFVGLPNHLRDFESLQVSLANTDGSGAQTVSFGLASTGSQFALGIWLELTASAVIASRLNSDGSVSTLKPADIVITRANPDGSVSPVPPAAVLVPTDPGFILSIKAREKAGVNTVGLCFWADVSLLHSKGAGTSGDFDFDWLFSQAALGDALEAVRPQALAVTNETQARIIAVSSPIPSSGQK